MNTLGIRTTQRKTDPMTSSPGIFDTAEQALQWAVEVLRRRRLPRNSRIWQEMAPEMQAVEEVWSGSKNVLIPTDPDERLDVALTVMEALDSLNEADARVLKLWSMGDWADEGRLQAALAIQERMRRQGVRVRMSYRYTYEQVAGATGCTKKTAWRRVQAALQALGKDLQEKGIVVRVEVPREEGVEIKKDVWKMAA
jgi:DNA-directed RNA polymerase specialized sigma24 family protein